MFRPFRSTLPVLALLLAAGCGKKSSTAPSVPSAVTTESANSRSATIGQEGGVLTTTSAAGVTYSLVVPPGALATPVTITPVKAMPLPGAGSLAAALDCRPNGLTFAHAAVLVIAGAGTPGAGKIPIGFAATSDADSFALGGAIASSGSFVMQVSHFSIQGLQFGTTADLLAFPAPPVGSTDQSFFDRIQRAVDAGDLAQARTLAGDWATALVLPALTNALTDAELFAAVRRYDLWRTAIDAINGFLPLQSLGGTFSVTAHFDDPALATPQHDAGEAAAPNLRTAILGNGNLACAQESFGALANVMFWQRQAVALGVADGAHQLDEASVFGPLCAHITLDDFALPAALQAGFPHSLDLDLGILFEGHAVSQGAPFQVAITATNADVQHPTGFTSANGHYTTVFTAIADGPIEVTVDAQLVLPGTTTPTPIHATFHANGSVGQNLTGDYLGNIFILCGLISSEWQDTEVHLVQNGNAISGTFHITSAFCNPDIPDGTISATLSDGVLFGLQMTHPDCGTPSDPILQVGVRMDPGDTIKVFGSNFSGTCHGAFGCMDGTNPSHVVPITGMSFQRLAPPGTRAVAAGPLAKGEAQVARRVAVWSPPAVRRAVGLSTAARQRR